MSSTEAPVKQSSQGKSIGSMVICSVLWSIAGIFIKLIPWNPFVITGFRSLLAAAVIGIYMIATKTALKVNRQAIISALTLCTTMFLFVAANKLTTSANAIVLQFTSPVFIVLISVIFYKQRFRRQDYVVTGIVMVGIVLCFSGQVSGGAMAGNCLAVLAGLTLGTTFVVTGNTDQDSRMSGILFGHILAAVIGIAVSFVVPTQFTPRAMLYIAILGIFQLGIPYILYALALNGCSPLVCCLISAIEPLLNPLWVFIFDGERPSALSLIGGALVILTITLWSIHGSRNSVEAGQLE